VLRAVVLVGAPADETLRAALLAQVQVAQVMGLSCTCGCASYALAVDRQEAPPALVGEVSGDAHNGEEGVGFRVLLADGYLVDVEIHGFGDNDASVWPAATIVR